MKKGFAGTTRCHKKMKREKAQWWRTVGCQVRRQRLVKIGLRVEKIEGDEGSVTQKDEGESGRGC